MGFKLSFSRSNNDKVKSELLRRAFNCLHFNSFAKKIPLNLPLKKGEGQSYLGYLAPQFP